MLKFFFFVCISMCILHESTETYSKASLLEMLYCGEENCYDILGVSQNSTKQDIRKAYRKMSLKYHPDRNTDPYSVNIFQKVAKAHEVLVDDENRSAYDFYLSHPNSLLALYYGFRAVYPTQTNPAYVFILILVIGSFLQYINHQWKRQWEIGIVEQSQKFKSQLALKLEEQYGKKLKKLSSEEQQKARESASKELLNTVEIDGHILGAQPQPLVLSNLFGIKILLSPFTISLWLFKQIRWLIKYRLFKCEFSDKDKEYLTYTALNHTLDQWNKLSHEKKQDYMSLQLWDNEQLKLYKLDQEEKERKKKINSARYRQWKRWKRDNC